MKIQSCLAVLFALLCSFSVFAKTFEIQSVRPVQKWSADKIQETQITITLPQNFHAYKDQIKILNIKPAGFKSGQIKLTPEVEFYDKFSRKNRTGFDDRGGVISILIEAPDQLADAEQSIEFDLRHQICSDVNCYFPKTVKITVPVTRTPATITEPVSQKSEGLLFNFENSLATNLPLAFLLVFLAGVLTSFTPCIFPMLPITLSILGHNAEKRSRLQNLGRSVVYVGGIATTYSLLGVAAAITGSLFGSALTNKYVLLGLCLLFFAMALSMWGFFELQAPAFVRNRLGTGKSKNNFEAYIMGLVAGIVASPCVGPVLISILTFVSTSKNVGLGFSLLFVFACGLGMLFILIGMFGETLRFLPRSGPWMNRVKFFLGASMWGAALYYLQFILNDRWWLTSVALSLLALSIWKGAFSFKKKTYFRQSFLMALFIFSFTVALLGFIRPQYLESAFSLRKNTVQSIQWTPYSEAEIQDAQAKNQPVIIDFFAKWCGACHELEEKTYTNPEFIQLSASFKLLQVDATEDTEATQTILKKYQVQGLPTVLFINRKGDLLKHLTFTQFITWDQLKPKILESVK
ncbi:MAG: hypothetical protein A2622_03010 [Bdellovibrionales bacterium RIFCSPHIGHO2_01_FULL_40_29]|nr:MAG: hypothetical protein A2622_03010 [Bdellovibrionales bacterium RIFCSPHIGHO2_01_FULL_40_29]OFZ34045.1 MAG: hypothetical protein A3D17_03430 [Bdellovibrionales bacterium RIFCSPHIGHO2_02_FULL_40_15]